VVESVAFVQLTLLELLASAAAVQQVEMEPQTLAVAVAVMVRA
jgi:hypothetical protein